MLAGIEVISCVSHTLYNTEDICAKNGGRPPLSYKVSSNLLIVLSRQCGYASERTVEASQLVRVALAVCCRVHSRPLMGSSRAVMLPLA